MSANRTGKYIHQLTSVVGELRDDASIPVSQDNLTRKATLLDLRKFLNGDAEQPSNTSYYSSQKITEIKDALSRSIINIQMDITNISAIVGEVQSNISNSHSELLLRITHIENNVNKFIDSSNKKIDKLLSDYNELATRITNIETRLTELTTNVGNMPNIVVGNTAPNASNLEEGTIYIQTFE